MTLIVGLAGLREVGKSLASGYLASKYNLAKVHPFNGGKAMCRAYFMHRGVDANVAWRMTDGDMKNNACPQLPDCESSRYFMERLGKFMGVDMGPSWTLERELMLAEKNISGRDAFAAAAIDWEGARDGHVPGRAKHASDTPVSAAVDTMVQAYLLHLGLSQGDADRMVSGDLGDVPCAYLPDRRSTSWMKSRIQGFMDDIMGAQWSRNDYPECPASILADWVRVVGTGTAFVQPPVLRGSGLLAESIVYEDVSIRTLGGYIARINRKGRNPTVGLETDAYTARMQVDYDIQNDGSIAELEAVMDELMLDVRAHYVANREGDMVCA